MAKSNTLPTMKDAVKILRRSVKVNLSFASFMERSGLPSKPALFRAKQIQKMIDIAQSLEPAKKKAVRKAAKKAAKKAVAEPKKGVVTATSAGKKAAKQPAKTPAEIAASAKAKAAKKVAPPSDDEDDFLD